MKNFRQKISRHPIISSFIFLLIAFGLTRVYYRATDDFRLANMTYPIPFHPEWEISPQNSEEKQKLLAILQQKFYYIGKGAQSYAFSSEDGRYVLKFFKFKHLKPSVFINMLPSIPPFKKYKDTQIVRKQRKLDSVFAGYKLSYDLHKPESGLLYIHLNPSQNTIHFPVRLVDKIGFEHTFDLDSVVFVLQEKAKTTRTVVNEALQKGDLALAKERIGQIFDLYREEYRKGIYDRDHGVMHNTGFVGNRPIHLDVGKMTAEEQLQQTQFWEKDLELIARKFQVWLRANYPNYYAEMAKDIEGKISRHYGHPFQL